MGRPVFKIHSMKSSEKETQPKRFLHMNEELHLYMKGQNNEHLKVNKFCWVRGLQMIYTSSVYLFSHFSVVYTVLARNI